MTRKKFRILLTSFVLISVSILSIFMITNIKSKKKSYINPSEVISEGLDSGSGNSLKSNAILTYFVNDGTVLKSTTVSKEVTIFEISAKLLITNNSDQMQSVAPELFSISYDTGESKGLLFNLDYGDIETPIVLQGKESTSINFNVKYILQEPENFNIYEKKDLKFNYANKQIFVCSV